MKTFTQKKTSSALTSRELARNLKTQLSELQNQMIQKRLEKKFDEVEMLEQKIDELHKKLLAHKPK
jgi:ethanolamine utilization cobalamin adenosyltransferase